MFKSTFVIAIFLTVCLSYHPEPCSASPDHETVCWAAAGTGSGLGALGVVTAPLGGAFNISGSLHALFIHFVVDPITDSNEFYPDYDFTELVTPTIPAIGPFGPSEFSPLWDPCNVSQELTDALNEAVQLQADVAGLLVALGRTEARYFTALQQGDIQSANNQYSYHLALIQDIQLKGGLMHDAFDSARTEFQASGLQEPNITQLQLEAFFDDLDANGWPSEELPLLAQFGLDEGEIQETLDYLIANEAAVIGHPPYTLSGDLQLCSDCAEYTESDIEPVPLSNDIPTVSQWGLIIMTGLLLALGDRKSVV